MNAAQLELNVPTQPRTRRKLTRANWWFERMREVVDKAIDWQPVKEEKQNEL